LVVLQRGRAPESADMEQSEVREVGVSWTSTGPRSGERGYAKVLIGFWRYD